MASDFQMEGPEGQAGAIAIAGAWAASSPTYPHLLFQAVLEYIPEGETRIGVLRAADLPLDYDVRTAQGQRVSNFL